MMKKAVFTLTLFAALIAAAPLAAQSSVTITNGGSFKVFPLSPGCWGTAFGDFASVGVSNTAADSVPFPTTLGGVQVLIGGTAAPMNFVGEGQINFLVPNDAELGQQSFEVTVSGMATYEGTINLIAASPGLLLNPNNGEDSGAVLNQDGTVNGPDNPASSGEVVVIFAVGPGPLSEEPPLGDVAPADPLITTTSDVEVFVSTESAPVGFSGLAPNLVNAWQLNVTVPEGTPTTEAGLVPIFVKSNGIASQPVGIWVQ